LILDIADGIQGTKPKGKMMMLRTIGYVDPGTGATLVQLALAGTVGIGAIVRLKWASIQSMLGRSDGAQNENPESATIRQIAGDE
jgi:hypothetical protein